MRFQQFGDRYIVRLEEGEPALATLKQLLISEDVGFASLSAAGAVQHVTLAFWNAETRAYEDREFNEQMEVVSFLGNASLKDGAPHLHIHGVFSRHDFSTVGGHVKEMTVRPTLEVWLRTEDVPVRRGKDPSTGLELLDLPEGSERSAA